MNIYIITALILQITFLEASETLLAFEIGTGKIKMQVVEIKDKKIKTLYHQSETISSDIPILDDQNRISTKGKERIITILKSLRSISEEYTHTKGIIIATELFRSSVNGKEVAEEISNSIEMEIEIISPEEEGILGFLSVVEEARLDPENIVVLDIGSGSFEITCKKDGCFLVYSVPFGRFPMYDLVKKNDLSPLEAALKKVPPEIINKIKNCSGTVIGIGAHPKKILEIKKTYFLSDLNSALQIYSNPNLDYSDLLIAKKIMEFTHIKQINYLGTKAGNTTGMFLKKLEMSSSRIPFFKIKAVKDVLS